MKSEDRRTFQAGDRVRYSAKFLKNIGCPGTDPLWREGGTVQGPAYKVGPLLLVKVLWDEDEDGVAKGILTDNVCKQGELSQRTAV